MNLRFRVKRASLKYALNRFLPLKLHIRFSSIEIVHSFSNSRQFQTHSLTSSAECAVTSSAAVTFRPPPPSRAAVASRRVMHRWLARACRRVPGQSAVCMPTELAWRIKKQGDASRTVWPLRPTTLELVNLFAESRIKENDRFLNLFWSQPMTNQND